MANITKTIKDYKELNEQVKIIQRNIKELNEAIAKETQPGITRRLQRDLKEQQIELKDTSNAVEHLADILSSELGDAADRVSTSTGTLRKQLLETRRIMQELVYAGEQDSDMFRDLQAEAVKMQVALDEASRSITGLSKNTGISGIGSQIKGLGAAMLSLDFNRIILQTNNLSASLGKISWKSTIDGIKATTTAFRGLGKALLTNPIFLIGAIIISVGVAIYKLMKETGLLQVAMEALGSVFEWLMKPINVLINGIKAITDAMGLTNNAAKDMANAHKDAMENIVKNNEIITAREAIETNNRKLLLEEQLKNIQDTDKDALESRLKIQQELNTLSEEMLETTIKNERDKLSLMDAEIAKYRAENGKKIKKEGSKESKEIEEMFRERTKLLLAIEDVEKNGRLKLHQDNADKLLQIEKNATKQQKEEFKQKTENYKTYLNDRLKAERYIRDLEIDLIKDEEEKTLERARETNKRRIEDVTRDETINRTERARIILLLEENLQKELSDIKTKYREQKEAKEKAESQRTELENKRRLDNLKTSLEAHYKYMDDNFNRDPVTGEYIEKSDYEKQKKQIENRYRDLIAQASEYYTDRLERATHVLELEYQMEMELKNLRDKMNKEDPVLSDMQKLIENMDSYKTILSNSSGEFGQLFEQIGVNILTSIEQMNAVLETQFENTTHKVLSIVSVIGGTISTLISSISEELNRQLDYDLGQLNASTNERMNNLNDMLANNLITNEEYNNKRQQIEAKANTQETKIRKEAFEDNKKAQIANATVSMLSGIIAAWGTSMQLGFPANIIVGGILTALLAGIGAANISKIKGTQFGGTSSSVSSGSTSVSLPSQNNNNTEPQFNFMGQGNNNNVQDFSKENNEQTINVHSTISVSEINEVQDSLDNSVSYTELGG